MFRKILCTTDFSAGSDHAMRVAIRLANESGAELVLAHAWHIPALAFSGELPYSAQLIDQLATDSERELTRVKDEALALGAKRLSTVLASGVPWDRLCALAKDDTTIDLIVMGTHGRTGMRRLLLGSVAEKVIRHAPCSVLAVRGGRDGTKMFQHILCPIDFSESARHATQLAVALAAPDGLGITLFHALDLPVRFSAEIPADVALTIDRRTTELMERWAADLRSKTAVPITRRTRIGTPGGQAIALLDHEITYDLAIVGSHGRTGISRALLGSVAEKIARHAPCPVLVARHRAPA